MSGYRLLVSLGVALLGLFVVPADASACSCAAHSACQSYARARAVFVAEVLDVTDPATPDSKTARVRVIRSYKGDAARGQTVTVVTLRGGPDSCSLDLGVGDRYVLFAGGSEGRYGTSMCQRSYRLAPGAALPDLPLLAGTVTGQLTLPAADGRASKVPMAGVPVWVATADGRIESRTDRNGRFRLDNVPTGMREVRFEVGTGEPVGMVIESAVGRRLRRGQRIAAAARPLIGSGPAPVGVPIQRD